jgi:uncharacterized protein with beta-barrel porin domain
MTGRWPRENAPFGGAGWPPGRPAGWWVVDLRWLLGCNLGLSFLFMCFVGPTFWDATFDLIHDSM